ncbi:hypothetical protein MRX96_057239 [Rhipicephalus microplus]
MNKNESPEQKQSAPAELHVGTTSYRCRGDGRSGWHLRRDSKATMSDGRLPSVAAPGVESSPFAPSYEPLLLKPAESD